MQIIKMGSANKARSFKESCGGRLNKAAIRASFNGRHLRGCHLQWGPKEWCGTLLNGFSGFLSQEMN